MLVFNHLYIYVIKTHFPLIYKCVVLQRCPVFMTHFCSICTKLRRAESYGVCGNKIVCLFFGLFDTLGTTHIIILNN
jgi:hypothetical protein